MNPIEKSDCQPRHCASGGGSHEDDTRLCPLHEDPCHVVVRRYTPQVRCAGSFQVGAGDDLRAPQEGDQGYPAHDVSPQRHSERTRNPS